jgi:hypothetical protein
LGYSNTHGLERSLVGGGTFSISGQTGTIVSGGDSHSIQYSSGNVAALMGRGYIGYLAYPTLGIELGYRPYRSLHWGDSNGNILKNNISALDLIGKFIWPVSDSTGLAAHLGVARVQSSLDIDQNFLDPSGAVLAGSIAHHSVSQFEPVLGVSTHYEFDHNAGIELALTHIQGHQEIKSLDNADLSFYYKFGRVID